ncbi:MAG: TetR/AcrR family transcriptional regulator [Oscillatoriaceae bacterium SKW80]|nr:TetR/AcrR family transcriptional regulator [Oscillatoriaceae bacterium SKYG93]MCX8120103.1 TetR/AcrR family transcriptional regulator [Oscillatoriaceae bacterium SKW80]MDW8453029.1 TetR/AcrR family transcriptional regulator [Oscillatoriaceae cyanobacterium SKYGB_i_bin93]HIK29060.1 TetR/AcrR family transcriptional regulator [Oscillatoriaceae cyanobacterium M7585_C2015_266]
MARAKSSEVEKDTGVEKVEQILKGAIQEFLAHGYAATSMDRVALAAGVSKATVYSYFRDKEALFSALVEQLAQKKFKVIWDTEKLAGNPKEIIRQLVTTVVTQALVEPEYLTFMRLIIGESGRFPNLAKTFVRYIAKPNIDKLTEYLANCPDFKLADPEATARICIGAVVHFILLQEVMHGKEIMPMEVERLIDGLSELLFSRTTT